MYNGITSKGSQYLAKCQAEGLPIKLSKVKIGNGTIQDLENPYNFTDVKSIKQEFEISEKSQVEEQLKIKVQIDNTSLEEGYFTKEIGIYADDNGQEILYWYINDGDQASWLPPASVSPVKFKYTFNIQVTTTETVIVNFTGKELWVDREFLNTELVKKLDKGTVPNSLNTAEKIVAALQGNGGLKFDENLLYLNDKGTKKKGGYYLDRLAEGIFECLEQTEETVNNSAKFKNISNKENSDRLDNLRKKRYTVNAAPSNNSVTIDIDAPDFTFAIVYACDNSDGFYWTSHILYHYGKSQEENHFTRYTGNKNLNFFRATTLNGSRQIRFNVAPEEDTKIICCEVYYLTKF